MVAKSINEGTKAVKETGYQTPEELAAAASKDDLLRRLDLTGDAARELTALLEAHDLQLATIDDGESLPMRLTWQRVRPRIDALLEVINGGPPEFGLSTEELEAVVGQ